MHTLYILLALFLVHSVCLSALTSCHFTIYICVDVGLCLFCSFYLGSVICFSFSPSTFPRRPGRMWTNLRNRWPPNEGPPLPRRPPNLRPNDPDWTVPHLWQDLWTRLGYAFFVSFGSLAFMSFLFIIHYTVCYGLVIFLGSLALG